jgi:hypothetical protein
MPDRTTITLLTDHAATALAADTLDYREIYQELREGTTLRKFADRVGSPPSIAYWSKYESGEITDLNHTARNGLRRAVGLPLLPPLVDSLAEWIDPDATVWRLGDATTGVIVFDRENVQEPPSTLVTRLCNRVTGTVKAKGVDGYRSLFDVPVATLARAIRDREEYHVEIS